MNLEIESYLEQDKHWPKTGRHILAQHDADKVAVYQAYRPDIGQFAASHGYFGGDFQLGRMSWIKPNFLWMMFRCGWANKENQESILAVTITREGFETILGQAVHSVFLPIFMRAKRIGNRRFLHHRCVCNGIPIIILLVTSWNGAPFS